MGRNTCHYLIMAGDTRYDRRRGGLVLAGVYVTYLAAVASLARPRRAGQLLLDGAGEIAVGGRALLGEQWAGGQVRLDFWDFGGLGQIALGGPFRTHDASRREDGNRRGRSRCRDALGQAETLRAVSVSAHGRAVAGNARQRRRDTSRARGAQERGLSDVLGVRGGDEHGSKLESATNVPVTGCRRPDAFQLSCHGHANLALGPREPWNSGHPSPLPFLTSFPRIAAKNPRRRISSPAIVSDRLSGCADIARRHPSRAPTLPHRRELLDRASRQAAPASGIRYAQTGHLDESALTWSLAVLPPCRPDLHPECV